MSIQYNKIGALLFAVLVLAACAKPTIIVPTNEKRPLLDDSYLLGPGDELNILVFNHVDLSGKFVVSEAGTVALPLVGEIRAAGRITNEVRKDYSDLLSNGFLINPNVSINISTYRPFFIIGGVVQPGAYPYQTGMTILHSIAIAGGHSELAIRDTPPLLKRGSGALVSGESVSVHTPVFPGDVVEIPERPQR